MIKKIIIGAWAIYSFVFVLGYIAMKFSDNKEVACSVIMKQPLKILMIVFPGESNACVDAGYWPKRDQP